MNASDMVAGLSQENYTLYYMQYCGELTGEISLPLFQEYTTAVKETCSDAAQIGFCPV
jgi:hypothetical protein